MTSTNSFSKLSPFLKMQQMLFSSNISSLNYKQNLKTSPFILGQQKSIKGYQRWLFSVVTWLLQPWSNKPILYSFSVFIKFWFLIPSNSVLKVDFFTTSLGLLSEYPPKF